MVSTGTHIPTQGAVPVVPYQYFGDKFLETDDFFGRLPTEIVKYMAMRGINTPEMPIMAAMQSGHILTFLKVPLKEAFVNTLLKKCTKEESKIIKHKLAEHGWNFPLDEKPNQEAMYG